MMDFQVVYDQEKSGYSSARYYVRVQSGASLSVRNQLTALGMTLPLERQNLWELLRQQVNAMRGDRAAQAISQPGHVFYQSFAFWIEEQQRAVVFTILFGLILRGKPRRGQIRGDFLLLVVNADELDDALRNVYHSSKATELIATPEAEQS